MRRNSHFPVIIIVIMLLFTGCTASNYLNENQRYFDGTKIKFIDGNSISQKHEIEEQLNEIINPKPNGKLLGSRPGVWFYSIAGQPKKNKGFRHFLKNKIGKKPVMMQDINARQIALRMQNHLINKGYFQATVDNKEKLQKKSGKVTFIINSGRPYRIKEISYPVTDERYNKIISSIEKESLLKPGQIYSLEKLKEEQQRIEDYLEDQGFYYFDDHYLIHAADSSVGDYQVNLALELSETTPEEARIRYQLGGISIYSENSDTTELNATPKNIDSLEGYQFVNRRHYVRPNVLADALVLKKGNLYSQYAEKYSLRRLMALGVYKYVNAKFDKTDSALLDVEIYLNPLPKKSLQLELQAVSKSNNFVGSSITTSFLNRNALGGAELLSLSLNASYDIQIGGQNSPPLNALDLSFETKLKFPKLIEPFNIDYSSTKYIPTTSISVIGRLQERLSVFRLTTFEFKFGYQWQETQSIRHELFPINVSYVELNKVSSDFDRQLQLNPNLSRSLEDQYIVGAKYGFTLNTKNDVDASDHRNHFYFNGNIDLSGNLFYLTEKTFKNQDISLDKETTPYAQYAKLNIDFRHFFKIDRNKQLATRLIAGVARAYGNSELVPFIKQFSAGGSDGIRAFRARSLGPGAYNQMNDEEDSQIVLDQTGDIKLEASVEYRTKIVGVMEGALFLDAGNIWLWEPSDQKPGSAFTSGFLRDFAVGAGGGLRFDFSFFVMRFDLAFPVRKPWFETGDRWVLDEIDFFDRHWRRENLLLNVAIGYPF